MRTEVTMEIQVSRFVSKEKSKTKFYKIIISQLCTVFLIFKGLFSVRGKLIQYFLFKKSLNLNINDYVLKKLMGIDSIVACFSPGGQSQGN